jgi:hypothetical protein
MFSDLPNEPCVGAWTLRSGIDRLAFFDRPQHLQVRQLLDRNAVRVFIEHYEIS